MYLVAIRKLLFLGKCCAQQLQSLAASEGFSSKWVKCLDLIRGPYAREADAFLLGEWGVSPDNNLTIGTNHLTNLGSGL